MQIHLIGITRRSYACGSSFTRSGGHGTLHPSEVTCNHCMRAINKDRAYKYGWDAGKEGADASTCPHAAGVLRKAWLDGYKNGKGF